MVDQGLHWQGFWVFFLKKICEFSILCNDIFADVSFQTFTENIK